MATIQELYTQASLSLAAYGDFIKEDENGNEQYALSVASLIKAGMAEAQANDFANKWTVVDQYSDFLTGMGATIFKNLETKQTCLAIQGTDSIVDILVDATLGTIGLSYFNPQYVELLNVIDSWGKEGKLLGDVTVTGHSLGGYLAVD